MLREWIHRLSGTLHPRRSDDDLEEELRTHLELATEEARRRQTHHGAVRRARIEAGGTSQALDLLRDQRGLPWLEDLARDLRHGLRALRRSPVFTAIALVTLALGIGANAAVFQLLDAIRLRALPVKNAEQLALVELADVTRWKGRRTSGYPVLTNPLWEHFRDHQTVFSGVLAWSSASLRFNEDNASRSIRSVFVSGEFFDVLGVKPVVGRLFTAADDRPGCGSPGAVVSHGFWQRQFGADSTVIGRAVTLNGRPLEVIGVSPAGFSGLEVGRSYDVAIPICSQEWLGSEKGWLNDGNVWWLTVMGRVPPDVPLERVNAQLDAASPGLFGATLPSNASSEYAGDYLALRLRAVPASAGVSTLRSRFGDPLILLLIITSLVLLSVCTNLACLLLARASTRHREFAVRLALGASRARLVRQVIAENGLLAVGGAAGGVALAGVLSGLLLQFLGPDVSLALRIDGRLIAMASVSAFLACLTFGVIPAWRASRPAPLETMKAAGIRGSGASSGLRVRQGLVISQVAISLVLLFGALLFAATLRNLLAVDSGFRYDGVSVVRVDFSRAKTPPQGAGAFKRDALDRIRGVPGVSAAAEARHVPLAGTGSSLNAWLDGSDPAGKTPVRLNAVSDGYLEAMSIRLVSGRDISARDSASSPKVALVNPAFASRLGIAGDPLGARFRAEGPSPSGTVYEIVGLVADTKYFALRETFLPIAFVPISQIADPRSFTDFVIRSSLPLGEVSSAVRRALGALGTSIDVDVRPFDATIRQGLVRERLMAALSGFFGVLAVLIAAIGLFGVVAEFVTRRKGEISVRMALGARRGHILAMVARQAGALLAVGLAVGILLVFAAAGAARSLVFGVEPHDAGLIGLACGFLMSAAIAAILVPTWRAVALEPSAALREE